MPKVVISTEVAGFAPEYSLLKGLYNAHPEAFDSEGIPSEEFGLSADASESEVAAKAITGILVAGMLFFMRNDASVRTLPWLVAEVERRGGVNCTWRGGAAKVVDVPDDVEWYLFIGEDGSESVHEKHRSWA